MAFVSLIWGLSTTEPARTSRIRLKSVHDSASPVCIVRVTSQTEHVRLTKLQQAINSLSSAMAQQSRMVTSVVRAMVNSTVAILLATVLDLRRQARSPGQQ